MLRHVRRKLHHGILFDGRLRECIVIKNYRSLISLAFMHLISGRRVHSATDDRYKVNRDVGKIIKKIDYRNRKTKLPLDFRSAIRKERGRKLLPVRRFQRTFQRDLFFFAFIRSVLFEKNLSSGLECNFCQQHGVSCEPVMQRNDKTYFRTKLRINKGDKFFLPSALKVLSRETSPDLNGAVVLEKQLVSPWIGKLW